MEFGKLPSVAGVDFALPDTPGATLRRLAAAPREAGTAPEILLGTARWADRSLLGTLYPKGTSSGSQLRHYAASFDTVELNATYYGFDLDRMRAWADQVPAGFRFCPKFPGSITHRARCRGVEAEADAFVDACLAMGDRLGLAWILAPEDLGPREGRALLDLIDHVHERIPVAVEVRDPAWFRDASLTGRWFDALAERHVPAVLTDVAGRRDVLHLHLATPELFLRFVGNAPDASDARRLDDWVDRLEQWFAAGLQRAWIFLHQPIESDNLAPARRLAAALESRLGVRVRAPRQLERAPVQRSLFGGD